MIQLVFARNKISDCSGFGYKQNLPWGHCSKDLQEFKKVTMDTVLIMGANTFSSLPFKLKDRVHAVICDPDRDGPVTKKGHFSDIKYNSVTEAISKELEYGNDISVIGGPAVLYEAAPLADKLIMTTITEHNESKADVLIDTARIEQHFSIVESSTRIYNHKEPNIKYITILEKSD